MSTHKRTSLSWAISWVFTWPDTRLTRPNTWPVSNPQIVQVVSMLEVPAEWTDLSNFINNQSLTYSLLRDISLSSSESRFLTQQIRINFIPVKGGEGSTEVWVLVVIQQTLQACFCVADLQDEHKRIQQWADKSHKTHNQIFTPQHWPSPNCTAAKCNLNINSN